MLENYTHNGSSTSLNADAGLDFTRFDFDADGIEKVILDGGKSSATSPTISQYDWKEGDIQIAMGMKPSVALALGIHALTLTISDNSGATHRDTVVVTLSSDTSFASRTMAGGTVRDGGDIQDGGVASLIVGQPFTAAERSAILVFQLPDLRPIANPFVNASFHDSDSDGMPNPWEMQMFTSLAKTAAGDDDGDGISNLDEFIAGTFSTSANSSFRVSTLTTEPSGASTLRWPSVLTRTYTVLKTTILGVGWSPVSTRLVGSGAGRSFTDEAATPFSAFYNIQVTRD